VVARVGLVMVVHVGLAMLLARAQRQEPWKPNHFS